MTNREEAIKILVNATYSDEWQGNEELTNANHIAIKSLEAWDEVLDKLKNEEEECEYYGDPGGAMGLGMAIKIIEQKLKEVEE